MRTLPEVCLPGRKEWEGSVSYCYKSDPREWVEVVLEEGPGLFGSEESSARLVESMGHSCPSEKSTVL